MNKILVLPYHLIESGKALIPVLHQLCEWGSKVRPMTNSANNQVI